MYWNWVGYKHEFKKEYIYLQTRFYFQHNLINFLLVIIFDSFDLNNRKLRGVCEWLQPTLALWMATSLDVGEWDFWFIGRRGFGFLRSVFGDWFFSVFGTKII